MTPEPPPGQPPGRNGGRWAPTALAVWALAVWALAVAALFVACGRPVPPVTGPVAPGETERGIASWYGPGFDGRQTANGETYDMWAMTAAHKTLPFDTVVEVENLDNGRRIRVRINDRGPFVRGRIIDLSRRGAERLGMIGSGTAPVRLVVIETARVPAPGDWRIQAGAFGERGRAVALVGRLEREGYGARIATGGGLYRVWLGPFDTRSAAEETARRMRRRGFEALVRQSGGR